MSTQKCVTPTVGRETPLAAIAGCTSLGRRDVTTGVAMIKSQKRALARTKSKAGPQHGRWECERCGRDGKLRRFPRLWKQNCHVTRQLHSWAHAKGMESKTQTGTVHSHQIRRKPPQGPLPDDRQAQCGAHTGDVIPLNRERVPTPTTTCVNLGATALSETGRCAHAHTCTHAHTHTCTRMILWTPPM